MELIIKERNQRNSHQKSAFRLRRANKLHSDNNDGSLMKDLVHSYRAYYDNNKGKKLLQDHLDFIKSEIISFSSTSPSNNEMISQHQQHFTDAVLPLLLSVDENDNKSQLIFNQMHSRLQNYLDDENNSKRLLGSNGYYTDDYRDYPYPYPYPEEESSESESRDVDGSGLGFALLSTISVILQLIVFIPIIIFQAILGFARIILDFVNDIFLVILDKEPKPDGLFNVISKDLEAIGSIIGSILDSSDSESDSSDNYDSYDTYGGSNYGDISYHPNSYPTNNYRYDDDRKVRYDDDDYNDRNHYSYDDDRRGNNYNYGHNSGNYYPSSPGSTNSNQNYGNQNYSNKLEPATEENNEKDKINIILNVAKYDEEQKNNDDSRDTNEDDEKNGNKNGDKNNKKNDKKDDKKDDKSKKLRQRNLYTKTSSTINIRQLLQSVNDSLIELSKLDIFETQTKDKKDQFDSVLSYFDIDQNTELQEYLTSLEESNEIDVVPTEEDQQMHTILMSSVYGYIIGESDVNTAMQYGMNAYAVLGYDADQSNGKNGKRI
eukprot:CAMPEP_0178945760 /NCGR_PEP_ID=MMETSP0789-20121207/3910_1 /TAXON_ID=3005 /ORGANISM="Rhizosolenia setigera, Strain CCMP 1694" /LENGTH=545 /DNA_ID=CAMNT_0020625679 /DNA_START=108 /DNA_END=1745 /DNA_ORIENTATION=-